MGRFINSTSVETGKYQQNKIFEIHSQSCGTAAACTWTVPTDASEASFEVWGAGGSGTISCCCYCLYRCSNPGTSGGYALKTIPVTPGDTYIMCAGAGGCMQCCNSTGGGYDGTVSYVTGTGLTTFCADGGLGGSSHWQACGQQGGTKWPGASSFCAGKEGGGAAFGGDVNIPGGWGSTSSCSPGYSYGMHVSGSSPFGGAAAVKVYQHCSPNGGCQVHGNFPGGGGSGASKCCCDCCACNGWGGNGMVRVTYK
jgi:hypothetical protein